jgi:uncharacterized protein
MPPIHAAVFAALSLLLLWALALRTTLIRIRARVFVGDGGLAPLRRATRSHGVSVEHLVPLMLLLLCLELLGADKRLVDAFGVAILVARMLHVFGFVNAFYRIRIGGMTLTYLLEPALALVVLQRAVAAL